VLQEGLGAGVHKGARLVVSGADSSPRAVRVSCVSITGRGIDAEAFAQAVCACRPVIPAVLPLRSSDGSDVSEEEREFLRQLHRGSPLPAGVFWDGRGGGRGYLNFRGEELPDHPSLPAFMEEYIDECNRGREAHNQRVGAVAVAASDEAAAGVVALASLREDALQTRISTALVVGSRSDPPVFSGGCGIGVTPHVVCHALEEAGDAAASVAWWRWWQEALPQAGASVELKGLHFRSDAAGTDAKKSTRTSVSISAGTGSSSQAGGGVKEGRKMADDDDSEEEVTPGEASGGGGGGGGASGGRSRGTFRGGGGAAEKK
jgi:hypothetical protein